jgi:hypothetical protein
MDIRITEKAAAELSSTNVKNYRIQVQGYG